MAGGTVSVGYEVPRQILALNPVHIDLPTGFGESASSRDEWLDMLLEYAAFVGLGGRVLSYQMPERFRGRRDGAHVAGAVAGIGVAGSVAAVGRQKGATNVCMTCGSTRRRVLAKIAGIGGVAALLAALGPLGKRIAEATTCGDCGFCNFCYCYHGGRYCEFYFCSDTTTNFCGGFCTGYGPYCSLDCGCTG